MPIYEFKCNACNKNFETLLTSSTQIAEVTCPQCQSKNIKKTISASSYRLNSSSSSIPAGALSGCSSKGGFS
ncbi:MAG: zinc ribbon domain-containing protein [Proteobacteria bacterium]|nr:zinc ribbon domain-containing protein [Pseudomonadota bacterium]MBU1640198.1 zinc ribbon domain-containing protein [Pseudomonadota bacterium]